LKKGEKKEGKRDKGIIGGEELGGKVPRERITQRKENSARLRF